MDVPPGLLVASGELPGETAMEDEGGVLAPVAVVPIKKGEEEAAGRSEGIGDERREPTNERTR